MDVARLLAAEETLAFVVEPKDAGARLDRFLSRRLPFASRTRVVRWIAAGRARIDGASPSRAAQALRAGQRITITVPKTPRDLGASLDDLLALPFAHQGLGWSAVVKPAGLPCHPAGGEIKRTLLTALAVAHQGRAERGGPWLPHRLDRDTAGLVVVAWRQDVQRRFVQAFARHRIVRLYRARVHGVVGPEATEVQAPLRVLATKPSRVVVAADGLAARTRLRVLARGTTTTDIEVEPITGRQHQIRVHLASIGHPIVGDVLYGPPGAQPLCLHAIELRIPAAVAGSDAECVVRSDAAF